MTSALSDRVATEVAAALGVLPEEFWDVNDDRCDCTYQRIGMWTNPYIAETLEVRMCCIWAELYKLFPQFVRTTPAFFDYNANEWNSEPRTWDGEADMPDSIWYRQIARQSGRTVAEARSLMAGRVSPRGIPRPVAEPEEPPVDVVEVLFEMIQGLADEVGRLRGMVEK